MVHGRGIARQDLKKNDRFYMKKKIMGNGSNVFSHAPDSCKCKEFALKCILSPTKYLQNMQKSSILNLYLMYTSYNTLLNIYYTC